LDVVLPRAVGRDWAEADQVGIEVEVIAGSQGRPLRLLIEKDFKCLHGGSETIPDAYPNPAADARDA
jgi:hypothetical protein